MDRQWLDALLGRTSFHDDAANAASLPDRGPVDDAVHTASSQGDHAGWRCAPRRWIAGLWRMLRSIG